jgi:hypothetical protein
MGRVPKDKPVTGPRNRGSDYPNLFGDKSACKEYRVHQHAIPLIEEHSKQYRGLGAQPNFDWFVLLSLGFKIHRLKNVRTYSTKTLVILSKEPE